MTGGAFQVAEVVEHRGCHGRAAPAIEQVRIVWRIGRGAAPAGAAGTALAQGRRATLQWIITGERAVATLRREGPDGPEAVVAEGRITRRVHDKAAGLDHLEIEGLLWLTLLRQESGEPRLLFARTTVLARLGVPGGRYEAPVLLD